MYYVLAPVLASPKHYIKRECTRDPITHYIFLFSQLSGTNEIKSTLATPLHLGGDLSGF